MSVETMTPDEMMAAMMSENKGELEESSSVKLEAVAIQTPVKETTIVSQGVAAAPVSESGRGDVSASTIARMMGMATAAEFRVLEGKVDLLSTKFNSITGKIDRSTSALANVATGSDLERIDVQISSLRTALNESVLRMEAALDNTIEKLVQATLAKTNKDGE